MATNVCLHCLAPNQPGAKFCARCGQALRIKHEPKPHQWGKEVLILSTIILVFLGLGLLWKESPEKIGHPHTQPKPPLTPNEQEAAIVIGHNPILIVAPPAPNWSPKITIPKQLFADSHFHDRMTRNVVVKLEKSGKVFMSGPDITNNDVCSSVEEFERRFQSTDGKPTTIMAWTD